MLFLFFFRAVSMPVFHFLLRYFFSFSAKRRVSSRVFRRYLQIFAPRIFFLIRPSSAAFARGADFDADLSG